MTEVKPLHSPDRVAGLEDEHGAGGVIVPVQALLPLPHAGLRPEMSKSDGFLCLATYL